MNAVGYMAMPEKFYYRDVFLKGKPRHDRFDRFAIRHPPMDVCKRAKIFSPFDALKGFNEAVAAKEVPYVFQIELTEEDKCEINRRLTILHNLTYNSRMAKQNKVKVAITYFVPCNDTNHEAYGVQGVYTTISGICLKVDSEVNQEISIEGKRIPFIRILQIESLSEGINFDELSAETE